MYDSPPRAVVTLGAGAASMGAVIAVNLAVIGLAEMLVVAFGEEEEEEDQTKEWAIPRLNRLAYDHDNYGNREGATARGWCMSHLYPTPGSSGG